MDNSSYMPDDWHSIPAAFSVLARATRRTNPEAFKQSARMLDANPIYVLKGLSYATCLLSSIPDNEDHKMMKQALMSIAEMTELMARLLEHKEEADIDEIIANQAQVAA